MTEKREKTEKEPNTEIVETQGNTPAAVIQYAITKGATVEELEKLLTLQERYDANEARKSYNVAMAAFKANPPKIDKDKTVSFKTSVGTTSYNHATLANVTEKISSELSKYGLSASWTTKQNGAVSVTCKITHIKGHSEETTITAPADVSGSKNAIQAIGSTITYLQRYSLLSLTGLATYDQDDDGQATTPAVELISNDDCHKVMDLIVAKNVDIAKFCKAFGIEDVNKLPKTRLNQAMLALQAKGTIKTGGGK